MGDTAAGGPDPLWPPGSLLGTLTRAQQERFVHLGTLRTVERGEVLIHQEARDRTVFLLLRGIVKVESSTTAGHTVTLAFRLAGDLVGELAALDDLPRSATVAAVTCTTVRSIGHDRFLAHLASDAAVDRAVHRSVAAKLRQATRMRSDTNSASALVRLARVLTQLGDRYGRLTPNGTLLALHATQSELAGLVCIAEASLERALKELRARGVVQTSYRQILLRDPVALAELAASG